MTPVGNQATPSNVTVSATPGSLPPGVYTAQVAIQTPEQNAVPIIVPVRLVISTQPLSVGEGGALLRDAAKVLNLQAWLLVPKARARFAEKNSGNESGASVRYGLKTSAGTAFLPRDAWQKEQ